jgi:PAS domain S-box-containing protein
MQLKSLIFLLHLGKFQKKIFMGGLLKGLIMKRNNALLLYGLVSLLLTIGGYYLYKNEEKNLTQKKINELKAIAELKKEQILKWKDDHIKASNVIVKNLFYIQILSNNRWSTDSRFNNAVNQNIRNLKIAFDYKSIDILDTCGKVLFTDTLRNIQDRLYTYDNFKNNIDYNNKEITDFVYNKKLLKNFLTVATPIKKTDNTTVGVLIKVVDLSTYFFPSIQLWPTSSPTSEILIVREEADSVRILNDVRLEKPKDFRYTVALKDANNILSKAILGNRSIIEGLDYRNTKVLAFVTKLPISNWVLVIKIDSNEILIGLKQRALYISLFIISLIGMLGIGMALINANQQKKLFLHIVDTEKALALEKYMVEMLLYNVPDHIYFKDVKSRFIRINQSLAESLGLENPDQATGKTDFDFYSKEHAEQAFFDEQKIIKTGEVIKKEEKETWPNKPETWASTIKLPLKDINGITIGTFGISRDITEKVRSDQKIKDNQLQLQKQNEEYAVLNEEYFSVNEELKATLEEMQYAKDKAEHSDMLKTAFLQNMSHEIRTPLNAIMGFSELIQKHFHNKPKVEQYTNIIIHRSNDLLGIINDILDISKIESGQVNISTEEFKLDELCHELKELFNLQQKRLNKNQLSLSFHLSDNLVNEIVIADKGKLKQILINLIGNALKFTNDGSINVSCELGAGQILLVKVSDTGIGIPKDKQTEIFDRFTQVHLGEGRLYGGTGLGLSIVKGLVSLLQGEVTVESKLEVGSTFFVKIPISIIHNTVENNINVEELDETVFPGIKILIVEDDEANAEFLKETLISVGIEVLHTQYGAKSIEIVRNNNPQLVLLDIRLPDINGYEVAKQLKKEFPLVKIIAETAYAAKEDQMKALKSGCDGYLSKPVKVSVLLETIYMHLADFKK